MLRTYSRYVHRVNSAISKLGFDLILNNYDSFHVLGNVADVILSYSACSFCLHLWSVTPK